MVTGLEESNLGVARKEHILGTVSDKLHETTSHCFIIHQDFFFGKNLQCLGAVKFWIFVSF
jgi:hypothetical protein